jgi:hypothetical protein
MDPKVIAVAFVSFWSLSIVGVYLVVTSLGNLRQRFMPSPADAPPRRAGVKTTARLAANVFLMMLGLLLVFEGVFFSYFTVFG